MRALTPLEKFSDRCTTWVGSPMSLIVHTILFISFFIVALVDDNWTDVMLVLTTIVSLEAIYLAILIQISVNRNTRSLEEVEEDIEEIQEDVDEIQEDVDEIQEDVGEIQEDIDEIHDETEVVKEKLITKYPRFYNDQTQDKKELLSKVIGELEAFRESLEKKD